MAKPSSAPARSESAAQVEAVVPKPAEVLGSILSEIISGKIEMLEARERIRKFFSSLNREDYEALRSSRLILSNRIVAAADGIAQELATIAAPLAE